MDPEPPLPPDVPAPPVRRADLPQLVRVPAPGSRQDHLAALAAAGWHPAQLAWVRRWWPTQDLARAVVWSATHPGDGMPAWERQGLAEGRTWGGPHPF